MNCDFARFEISGYLLLERGWIGGAGWVMIEKVFE